MTIEVAEYGQRATLTAKQLAGSLPDMHEDGKIKLVILTSSPDASRAKGPDLISLAKEADPWREH